MLPRGPLVPEIPSPPALTPLTVRGRDVATRPVDPARDAPALFAACAGDDEMWTYMGYGPFADAAAMQAWMTEAAASADPSWFTVTRRTDDAPIGLAALMNHAPAHRRVEIGHIWYARAGRRTTANTEVVLLAGDAAFARYGCRRFEWKCDALNARSRVAAERLGFRFEGVFRNHLIVKGRSRDTAWFSITDDEWPEVRAALGWWVHEAPRDAGGRPTSPLKAGRNR